MQLRSLTMPLKPVATKQTFHTKRHKQQQQQQQQQQQKGPSRSCNISWNNPPHTA